jgi:hypothetical protein
MSSYLYAGELMVRSEVAHQQSSAMAATNVPGSTTAQVPIA